MTEYNPGDRIILKNSLYASRVLGIISEKTYVYMLYSIPGQSFSRNFVNSINLRYKKNILWCKDLSPYIENCSYQLLYSYQINKYILRKF
jgi:hypothetical protein